jgi:hypothetical protein
MGEFPPPLAHRTKPHQPRVTISGANFPLIHLAGANEALFVGL